MKKTPLTNKQAEQLKKEATTTSTEFSYRFGNQTTSYVDYMKLIRLVEKFHNIKEN